MDMNPKKASYFAFMEKCGLFVDLFICPSLRHPEDTGYDLNVPTAGEKLQRLTVLILWEV